MRLCFDISHMMHTQIETKVDILISRDPELTVIEPKGLLIYPVIYFLAC